MTGSFFPDHSMLSRVFEIRKPEMFHCCSRTELASMQASCMNKLNSTRRIQVHSDLTFQLFRCGAQGTLQYHLWLSLIAGSFILIAVTIRWRFHASCCQCLKQKKPCLMLSLPCTMVLRWTHNSWLVSQEWRIDILSLNVVEHLLSQRC